MSKKKFIINKDMFNGEEFNALIAAGDGRRLWVSYCDGVHCFKVENLRNDCEVVLKTTSLKKAIRIFNEL